MRHTTYTDPSGFDPSTVSTAADQLRLARAPALRLTVLGWGTSASAGSGSRDRKIADHCGCKAQPVVDQCDVVLVAALPEEQPAVDDVHSGQ